MLAIQDVGCEIFEGNVRNFYVFGGSEYGIKEKYIEMIEKISGKRQEYPSMKELISMLSKKHILPLESSTYIIRYDDEFVSSLSESVATKVEGLKFPGTIICMYENAKQISKLDKYLPNHVVYIDAMGANFIEKHLSADFPNLPKNVIHTCACKSPNFWKAVLACRSLCYVDSDKISCLSDSQIVELLGFRSSSVESQIRICIAARNFSSMLKLIDIYEGDIGTILYTSLQTMIELDKLLDNRYTSSDIREYVKKWTREDVYYMFNHTYQVLIQSRSCSVNMYNQLVWLFSLLKFERIPNLEVLK